MVIFGGFAVFPAQAADYDLVILNGRVMDPETIFDEISNVGIKDGKIAIITTEKISGKESINAKGHIVSPGFIDAHHHTMTSPFGQKLALRDGLTSPMENEAGVYPVGEWYESMEGKSQTNYGATVGNIGVRETVLNPNYKSDNGATMNDVSQPIHSHVDMAWSTNIATDEQIAEIKSKLDEGLRQGALGVGYTPGYQEFAVTSKEGLDLQELAGKYGRAVYMHGRFSGQNPSMDGILGTLEQIGAQAAYGGGLLVQHMTAQTLAGTKTAQALIDNAALNGIRVASEIYPYTFGSTIVAADYLHPDNYQKNMGHDYGDITEVSDVTPLTKARYDELVKTAPMTNVTFENATKEDLNWALAHPTSMIGSDAYPYVLKSDGTTFAQDWDTPYDAVNGHPRGAGTHAKVLRLVREEKLMSYMLAISKMSYHIAKFMEENGVEQMANKGRLQVGKDADITIFNPETVKDNSTVPYGGLPSTGIPYVVVNGTIVVKDSKVLKGVFPGKPIRAPVRQ